MGQTNQEMRKRAKVAGIKLWQIAEALGITDSMFSRKLRKELPAAEKEKVLKIIAELGGGENNG